MAEKSEPGTAEDAAFESWRDEVWKKSRKELNAELQTRAGAGEIDHVRELLSHNTWKRFWDWKKPDVNADRGAALVAACAGGHTAVVALLHKSGAEIAGHAAALGAAAEAGHAETVEYLLRHGASPLIGNALDRACAGGHAETVDALIEAGAKPSAVGLAETIKGGHLELADSLLERGGVEAQPWMMFNAACNGRTDIVEYVLSKVKDIDSDWVRHALERAERGGHAETAALIRAKLPVDESAPETVADGAAQPEAQKDAPEKPDGESADAAKAKAYTEWRKLGGQAIAQVKTDGETLTLATIFNFEAGEVITRVFPDTRDTLDAEGEVTAGQVVASWFNGPAAKSTSSQTVRPLAEFNNPALVEEARRRLRDAKQPGPKAAK